MGKKVELNKLMKLFTIFVKKNWTSIDGYDEVLNRFGELFDTLEEEEIELVIELTEQYHWMTYNDYHVSIRNLLRKVSVGELNRKRRLYIFPIIKPTDEDEIKSGHVVAKMITSIKSSLDEFDHIDVILLTEFDDLNPSTLEMTSEDFLILVDDYVGSGNTLFTTIREVKKNESVTGNCAVLTIAVQEEARNLLAADNIPLYFVMALPKGISGIYNPPELEKKLHIMTGIENRIPKVKNYRHGYERSEALITLMRTPNNTFPVFWKGIKHKGAEIKSPFPRH